MLRDFSLHPGALRVPQGARDYEATWLPMSIKAEVSMSDASTGLRREADAAHEVLKARVREQAVEEWIRFEKNHVSRVLLITPF